MSETNNQVASDLVRDLLNEKRADRRSKNIRFVFWFALIAYICIGIFTYFNKTSISDGTLTSKYTALIRVDGMIAPGRDFSSEELIPVLKKAFSDKNALGVVIDINSPGGTPVQAAIIHDSIIAFKKKYHKRVIIVGEDLLTSGAYYVAVAGDRIYVNPNTITGSIGVIMKGFGFVDLIKKIGVQRRVYLAGNNKDRLDPFLPQSPDDLKKVQQVIEEVHQNFSQAVLEGRKGKLRADPAILFSGDFWSGQTAVKLGLVDEVGNLMQVLEKEFKTSKYKEYSVTTNFLKLVNNKLSSAFDSLFYLYA